MRQTEIQDGNRTGAKRGADEIREARSRIRSLENRNELQRHTTVYLSQTNQAGIVVPIRR